MYTYVSSTHTHTHIYIIYIIYYNYIYIYENMSLPSPPICQWSIGHAQPWNRFTAWIHPAQSPSRSAFGSDWLSDSPGIGAADWVARNRIHSGLSWTSSGKSQALGTCVFSWATCMHNYLHVPVVPHKAVAEVDRKPIGEVSCCNFPTTYPLLSEHASFEFFWSLLSPMLEPR